MVLSLFPIPGIKPRSLLSLSFNVLVLGLDWFVDILDGFSVKWENS
jgi:hypothetical protein